MIDENIVSRFNKLVESKGYTLYCAESITAGLLASTIASVSGASSVLKGSIVTYQPDIKEKILGVDSKIIELNTAESRETTSAMAEGLTRHNTGADICIAVTGVASPPDPTSIYKIHKPVGQIYVAIHFKGKVYEFDPVLPCGSRNAIREAAVLFIMEKVAEAIA